MPIYACSRITKKRKPGFKFRLTLLYPFPLSISDISFIVSALSLYVAMRVAWDTRFKPPKLVALLSRISVWERGCDSDSVNRTRLMLPTFWIRNLGARPAIISNLRLQFACGEGQTVVARPEGKFLVSMLTQDTNVTFREKDKDIFPIDLDALFTGFCLVADEVWEANYSFQIADDEYQKIHGRVELRIQVYLHGSRCWKTIEKTTFDFENRVIDASKPDMGFLIEMFYPETGYR
jgi:hypothetical protein